jgi:hypothetical protein
MVAMITPPLAISRPAGSPVYGFHLNLPFAHACLEARLRERCWPVHDAPVPDVEARAVTIARGAPGCSPRETILPAEPIRIKHFGLLSYTHGAPT